jgi:transcriptional regulator with XRE-family HTH domain
MVSDGPRAEHLARLLAEVVIEMRLRKGWSRAQLARRASVAESSIRRLEMGHTLERLDTLELVCVPLDRCLEEVLSEVLLRYRSTASDRLRA